MNPKLLLVLSLSLVLVGCEEPLSIDTHRDEIAAKLGVSAETLLFASHGDIARPEELDEGYSKATKGIFVMTETDLYWSRGQVDSLTLDDMVVVPIVQVTGAGLDWDLVQIEVNGELVIFRPHAWNQFEGDQPRSIEVLRILSENDVPMQVVARSFRSPADYHSAMGTGLYGEASAEAAIARAAIEEADVQWSLRVGEEGVPLVPPSEQLMPYGQN